MVSLLGCILCQIDVASASMLAPLAQAAIITAPIVFRKDLKRALRRARGLPSTTDADGPTQDEAASSDGPLPDDVTDGDGRRR